MDTTLEIPPFLRRTPGDRGRRANRGQGGGRTWLRGAPPKPPRKAEVRALVRAGWSAGQARSLDRAEAIIAAQLQSPPHARFANKESLFTDGGTGRP